MHTIVDAVCKSQKPEISKLTGSSYKNILIVSSYFADKGTDGEMHV